MQWAFLIAAAYLLGAVPFGWLLARGVRGVDVRTEGSGNIGATNVLRVCGWRLGLVAFALDVLKGFAPAFWLAPLWFPPAADPEAAAGAAAAAALAAVTGHTLPVYLRFKGGKGVATSAGAFLALAPAATGLALGAFLVLVLATRYVSVASTGAAAAIVAAQHVLAADQAGGPYGAALPVTVLTWLVLVLVVVRHRSNYGRLLRGEENRIGAKRADAPDAPAPEPDAPVGAGDGS
ncbi:MAG: glycerol-3-phosphate 1-O-acyltransferase PlsY [Planctomycetota bacterium]